MADSVYSDLEFPPGPAHRPYILVNVVATVDGKTTTSGRCKPVQDLGSDVDHATMHALEEMSDAVLLGAGTIRATPRINLPADVIRVCLTRSGDVPIDHNFFQSAPDRAFVCTPPASNSPEGVNVITASSLEALVSKLNNDHGVRILLVEGGPNVTGQFLEADLVDELFVTISPKLKMGNGPNLAEGQEFPADDMPKLDLVSCIPVGSEVFLRYRRHI
jgi:riboflavin biosynthesis pyrimidine reductase